ncbi:restriction endonuclease subunit S [Staphylococcus epidermidis]|uniref:restriction endonuclease subunit S n=1 Tax=Staphylococcus epidermidis TaxID=1282 RepID=UPI0019D08921|nr:restriction endonuclease subunit S [Staphylococcus epidermidis]MBN6836937.1 restriction endonuclease subunit S [Staphylococcus epidermidis]MCG2046802.1 restriction endonuclease subunit S [Staphylococcus epidermidis]
MTEQTNTPALRFPGFSENWEIIKVRDLSQKTIGGGTPNTSKSNYWKGELNWIQSSDLSLDNLFKHRSKKYINDKALNNSSAKKIPANSIAIVSRVGVGKLVYINHEYATSQDFINLVHLNYPFKFIMYSLYLLLKGEANKLQGTSIKGLTKKDLLNYPLNIPKTIEEQEKIGVFFNKLDRQIELEEEKLELLEQQKHGYMQKIFSRELRFKDDNGNDYPNWENEKLGDLINEVNERTTSNNQYVLLSSTKNGLLSQEEYFKKQIGSKDSTGYKILRLNQLVLSPQNLWLGNINFNQRFDIGIVSPSYRIYNLSHQFDINFAKDLLKSPRYIYEYAQASEQGASVVRRNLNLELFYSIKISLPSIEEQRKIGVFLNKLDKLIRKQYNKIEVLKQRKKGLLQKMFV